MRQVKILWIDDSEQWVSSLQENLNLISEKNDIRFSFINAINGDDIIQQCRSFDFDLIVMDYDMEPFTGEKYIGDVRDEEHLEHIDIIFYSQNNSIKLEDLVSEYKKVKTAFRPNLEDLIKERFFKM
ncbi:response regulator [Pedobacter cryophilus]|uniref:Response regulator n=1 Tax=Pedobacter cryophilus TaxID=2571271 RepID=A0A4U1C4S1_9SPHI|nr:response regulator [Pedobacter cryophilus]TKC00860.1 response regulator [Pedobacter cryophilus]